MRTSEIILAAIASIVWLVSTESPVCAAPNDDVSLIALQERAMQRAVDAVADGGVVKVAAGIYRELANVQDRTVCLRGGYPGMGAESRTAGRFEDTHRDWGQHLTLIDGGGIRRCVRFRDAGGEVSLHQLLGQVSHQTTLSIIFLQISRNQFDIEILQPFIGRSAFIR